LESRCFRKFLEEKSAKIKTGRQGRRISWDEEVKKDKYSFVGFLEFAYSNRTSPRANIEEALPILEQIVKRSHGVKIFYLHGGKYPENVKMVSKIGGIKIIPVKDPETDLQYLVTKETSEYYGASVLVFKA